MRTARGAYKITYADENGQVCTEYQSFHETVSDELAHDIDTDRNLIYVLIGKDIAHCRWLIQYDILHIESLDFCID